MPAISAILITYNEEADLPEALASLRGVADEVVVVDSGSTDRTREIAQEMGARVVVRPFTNFGEQKNFAAAQASNEWLLSIDADERLNAELREAIAAWKQTQPQFPAYEINRQPNYLGGWIRHSGWYPEYCVRLYRRDAARFVGALHESVHVDGRVGRLPGNILHYTIRSLGGTLRQDGCVHDARGRGPLRARAKKLARRNVGGGAVDAGAEIFLPAGIPGRLSRRADRLDLGALRVAEIPQAGRAGAGRKARGARLAAGAGRLTWRECCWWTWSACGAAGRNKRCC